MCMRITIEYDGKRVIRNKNGVTKKIPHSNMSTRFFFSASNNNVSLRMTRTHVKYVNCFLTPYISNSKRKVNQLHLLQFSLFALHFWFHWESVTYITVQSLESSPVLVWKCSGNISNPDSPSVLRWRSIFSYFAFATI